MFAKKEVMEVSYHDIEKLIQNFYNRKDYEIVPDEEWSNDSSHEFRLEKNPLDKYDQKQVDEFKSGKRTGQFILYTLLEDLCNRGEIPEGNILINVSW